MPQQVSKIELANYTVHPAGLGRAVHCITTLDKAEAFAMLFGPKNLAAMENLVSHRSTILAAVEKAHGGGPLLTQIIEDIEIADQMVTVTNAAKRRAERSDTEQADGQK